MLKSCHENGLILSIMSRMQHIVFSGLFIVLFNSCQAPTSKWDMPSVGLKMDAQEFENYLVENQQTEDVDWAIQMLKYWKDSGWNVKSTEVAELVNLHKGSVVVCQLGADYFLKVGDIKMANELNGHSRQLGANHAEFYRVLAVSAVYEKKFDKAIDYINEAISMNVRDAGMYTQKGEVYLAFGDTLSGIRYLEKSYALDSSINEVGLKIARLYFDTNQLEKSVEWLSERVKSDSTHEDFQFLLAEVYYAQGQEPKALAIFRAMLAQENLVAGTKLLAHFEKYRQMDSTLFYANRILELDSLNVKALNQKAMSFDSKGYFPSALQYYQKTLDIDSTNEEALQGMAKVEGKMAYLRKLKERREAIPRMEFTVPITKKELINE